MCNAMSQVSDNLCHCYLRTRGQVHKADRSRKLLKSHLKPIATQMLCA